MAWIITALVFFFLGYKTKTFVEFISVLKIKNYCEYFMRNNDFQVINVNKFKNKKLEEEGEL